MTGGKLLAGEAAMKKLREEAAKKRKPKYGGPGNEDDNDNTAKRQKKFDKAVQKQAKKIVASVMEADEQNDDEFTARINAAIKKRSGTPLVSAAEVSETSKATKRKDLTEKNAKVSQKAAKLASIMKKVSLNKNKKNVTVEG